MLPLFVYSLFRFSIGIMLPVLQNVYSMSNSTAGILGSASVAATGIGVGMSGILSEKSNEKTVCFGGMLIFAIPLGLSLSSTNFVFFATLLILSGLGSGLMTTPIYTLAGNLFPKRRGTAIGVLSSGYNLGGFIGPTMTGFFISNISYRLPFQAIAVIGIVIAIIFQIGLPSPQTIISDSTVRKRTGFSGLLRNRNIFTIAICMLLADFAFIAYVIWVPKFLEQTFLASITNPDTIPVVFGIGVGLGGIGIIVGGQLMDRIGGRRAALISGLMAGTTSLGLFLSNNVAASIALVLVVGFFSNWFWGLMSAMAQSNVPSFRRTSVTGLVQAIAFIGAVFGPGITGIIAGPSLVTSASLVITVSIPYLIFAALVVLFYRDPSSETIARLSNQTVQS